MKPGSAISTALLLLLLAAANITRAEAAVVLIYHRFDDGRYPATNLGLETFRQQLEWLAANRFTVWPASKLVKQLQNGAPIPDHVAVITVDDGYRSLRGAAALLEEFRFPFSVFVSTGPIDQRLPDLLGWEELRNMCAQGAEILNHARDHDSLLARPGETDAERRRRILDQVAAAQHRIDGEIPESCRSNVFSYPYGEYDGLAEQTLDAAGYAAFGQQSGPVAAWNSLQALPRYPVNQALANSPLMITKLMSLPFPAVLDRQGPVVTENPPSLSLHVFPEIERVRCYDGQGAALERQQQNTVYRFRAAQPLAKGRNRYNCTYPSVDGERYHWLSQFWYVP